MWSTQAPALSPPGIRPAERRRGMARFFGEDEPLADHEIRFRQLRRSGPSLEKLSATATLIYQKHAAFFLSLAETRHRAVWPTRERGWAAWSWSMMTCAPPSTKGRNQDVTLGLRLAGMAGGRFGSATAT